MGEFRGEATDSGMGAVASRGHSACVWLSSLSWGVLEGRVRESEGAGGGCQSGSRRGRRGERKSYGRCPGPPKGLSRT